MTSLPFLKKAVQHPNVRAFMQMIRKCEGTDAPDGYNYLFGSSPHNDLRFTDFSKHPNRRMPYKDHKTFSTAAGAYQLLYATWTRISSMYSLPDFTPGSQDIACAVLISEKNSLIHLMDGHFKIALDNCGTVWASLPNSQYGQPRHSVDEATGWYVAAGGKAL